MKPTAADFTALDKAYKRLHSGILIDKQDLDGELVQQPAQSAEISNMMANAISYRDAAKEHLEITRAKADEKIRRDYATNEIKITEAAIINLIVQDAKVVEARELLRSWETMVTLFTGLRSSFSERQYMLSKLADLWMAGYWTSDSAGRAQPSGSTSPARRALSRDSYDANRQHIAGERRRLAQRGQDGSE